MVLMVFTTFMALSVIWGTYFRRRLLAKGATAPGSTFPAAAARSSAAGRPHR
jgi:hypothetical protein